MDKLSYWARKRAKRMQRSQAAVSRKYMLAWFARVNWRHHVLPAIDEAASRWRAIAAEARAEQPYLSVLSDEYLRGNLQARDETPIWADSASLWFGNRAVPGEPAVPRKNSVTVLTERGASLDFFGSPSGAVTAVIAPPRSSAAEAKQSHFVVGLWLNPADLDQTAVTKLLSLTWNVNIHCGVATFPGKKGIKLLEQLQSRHDAFQGKRSWAGRALAALGILGKSLGTAYHAHALLALVPAYAATRAALDAIET